MRRLRIEPALNGYIVNVCDQKLVYNSRSSLLTALDNYLSDPTQVEKDYLSHAVNPIKVEVAVPERPVDKAKTPS